jgi:hypothetical protein
MREIGDLKEDVPRATPHGCRTKNEARLDAEGRNLFARTFDRGMRLRGHSPPDRNPMKLCTLMSGTACTLQPLPSIALSIEVAADALERGGEQQTGCAQLAFQEQCSGDLPD